MKYVYSAPSKLMKQVILRTKQINEHVSVDFQRRTYSVLQYSVQLHTILLDSSVQVKTISQTYFRPISATSSYLNNLGHSEFTCLS
jgi:hypothetical protein